MSNTDRVFICVFLQCKSVTSCFLNKKFVSGFLPGSGNRIKLDQLRFVLLKNHSIYPNSDQGTKIRRMGRGGLPPLNVEFAQHYLQCKSVTSCFPGEILSPPNAHYLEMLWLQQFELQKFPQLAALPRCVLLRLIFFREQIFFGSTYCFIPAIFITDSNAAFGLPSRSNKSG